MFLVDTPDGQKWKYVNDLTTQDNIVNIKKNKFNKINLTK
jgi:hypothetical protein